MARAARYSLAASAIRSAWISRRMAISGSPTIRSTAWATTSRPARSITQRSPARISASPGMAAAACAPSNIRSETPPADAVPPVSETVAHAADLGMTFYTGTQVPEEISRRDFLRPAWLLEPHGGRWGAGDVHPRLRGRQGRRDGAVRGRLVNNGGEYLGRPVDVAQLPDGSLLVSDDLAGAIYRIWYEG